MTDHLPPHSPPHSLEAEEAALGCMIIDPDAWLDIETIISAEDFYSGHNRMVFDAIMQLNRAGDAVDFLTLSELLRDRKQLETIGDQGRLIDLINAVPMSTNAKSYARQIHSLATRRKLLNAASEIVELAYSTDEAVDACVDGSQAAVMAVSDVGNRDFTEQSSIYVDRAIERIERAGDNQIVGLSSGFEKLDVQIGGFDKGELHVFAAVDKMGKSTLAWQIGLNVALGGAIVAGFDLEMTQDKIALRWLSAMTGIPHNQLKRNQLTVDQRRAVHSAASKLRAARFPIHSRRGITPAQIRSECRRQQARYGQIDMVIVDYYQLMRPSNSKIYDVTVGLEQISAEMVTIAGDFQCALLLTAQINSKQLDHLRDKRPKPSMVSRSSALAKDCTSFNTLFDEDRYEDSTGVRDTPEGMVEIETHAGRESSGGRCYLKKDFACRRFLRTRIVDL